MQGRSDKRPGAFLVSARAGQHRKSVLGLVLWQLPQAFACQIMIGGELPDHMRLAYQVRLQ